MNGTGTTGHPHAKKQTNKKKQIKERKEGRKQKRKEKEKKVNLVTDLATITKVNSKCITDLNVKFKTIKLLEDNKGVNLDALGYGDVLLYKTPKV